MCKLKWKKVRYGFGGNCKKVNSIEMEVCEVEWVYKWRVWDD